MEHVDLAGVRIAFRRQGSGPPLLLLHGGACDSRVWRVELSAFADAFTVVAWDAPGCGRSSDLRDPSGMDAYAACLGELVDALGLGPAHLVGHSWGSSIALALSAQRPELVRSLVLVAPYAGWAGSLPPDEVARRLAGALAVADLAAEGRYDPWGEVPDALPAGRQEELAEVLGDIRPEGTRATARAMAEADLREAAAAVRVPTLVVAGGADVRSPLAVGRDLADRIPGATMTVLPGLGHECFLQSSEAFERAVREFLGGTAARP